MNVQHYRDIILKYNAFFCITAVEENNESLLISEIYRKLGRVVEKVMTICFCQDVYRQQGKTTLPSLMCICSRGSTAFDKPENFSKIMGLESNSITQGLKVDYPLLIKPQLNNEQHKMFFCSGDGNITGTACRI